MNTGKKIIFTESAKDRLENFHFEINQEIENYFQERKYVPGDDFIEITALDIKEITRRIRIVRPSRTNIKKLIPVLYTTMGVILILFGLFYDQIFIIIRQQPKRLIFIVGGLAMLFVSWFYIYFIRIREKRDESVRTIIEEQQREKFTTQTEKKSTTVRDRTNRDINNVQTNIIIHSAKYFCEKNWLNVTSKIKELVASNIFEFTISNDLMGGDPFWNKQKVLDIECTINGIKKKISAVENTTMKIE